MSFWSEDKAKKIRLGRVSQQMLFYWRWDTRSIGITCYQLRQIALFILMGGQHGVVNEILGKQIVLRFRK